MHQRGASRRQRGQLIALFALALTGMMLMAGVAIDGGYALAQRRAAQNASDFAALAGARIVTEWIAGDSTNGTDANVRASIVASIAASGGTALAFGAPFGPAYLDSNGGQTGYVGNAGNVIPAGSVGVKVSSGRTWTPFFLGVGGISSWSASATATAKGGYRVGGPTGPVFPIGIASSFFSTYPFCAAAAVSSVPSDPCYPQHLTPGNTNVPGGFGWLSFGCAANGLGQNNSGCANNSGFLQSEIGPPGNSYGCCTSVGLGGPDQVKSLPGNKVGPSSACDYYINNNIVVNVAVWDVAGGNGSNAYYHIIGFAAFQITACNGGKAIQGVWRRPMTLGPTTTTPSFSGQPLAVQLIH